ncbi:MAG: hypothetical protein MUC38_07250 [Cyclobacteriaceae bacterium]|jgi:hypothetical protein|nr:hypothetical protein [Cyclobacteriaceae bacterium]
MRLVGFLILILFSCEIAKEKVILYSVQESDFSWNLILENKSPIMFVKSDSIFVIDGRRQLSVSLKGTLDSLKTALISPHTGSMLFHYSICARTPSSYNCEIKLTDSTEIKSAKFYVEGINGLLSYPTCYLSLKGNKNNYILDFSFYRLDIYDVAQVDSHSFVVLYDYTPHEIDKAGIKRIGLLDLSRLEGDNSIKVLEYLKDRLNEIGE